MDNKKPLIAHLSMFTACAIWGLMSPLGKDAMTHGLDGIAMVSFRVAGGAILFWLTSLLTGLYMRAQGGADASHPAHEHVPLRDKLKFAGAAVFGLVCNQCCFTIGLSITSPVNASIVTTSMPIFAMLLSFVILHEPLTMKKVIGVLIGCAGAVTLILTSVSAASSKVGDIRGDLLVLGAQLSYALFLSLFNKFIKRYSIFTVNKWMFLWATIIIWPFSVWHVIGLDWGSVPLRSWLEAAYVVVFGTFIGYILIVNAQKVLRPTVVSIYNYVQPAVAVTVSLLTGIGVFKPTQGLAVLLVFIGVWLVTKSKSRRDMLQEQAKDTPQGNP
ncbi:MAG: DMT family transporter [Prevotella sp.]|nr:DMT family transporter [Prevotella sp.]